MNRYVVIDKNVGETPLRAMEKFRTSDPSLQDVPLTYAGRLDPMASGKLLVLIGDECKKRDEYTGLDKEYEFQLLFGFETDTGDILGIAELGAPTSIESADVRRVARAIVGKHTLPYPVFSSKTVQGVPLFQYALEHRLNEIEIPKVDIEIYKIRCREVSTISHAELLADILEKTNSLETDPTDKRIGSDFRVNVIQAKWRELLSAKREYKIAEFSCAVSSGTYIRSIAPMIAQRLGTRGLAYSIHRTKIGKFNSIAGIGFWSRSL